MLAVKKLAGVIPEVNLTKHTSEGSTLALKPRAHVTSDPKQGYRGPHIKDLCAPKIKKKTGTYWPFSC